MAGKEDREPGKDFLIPVALDGDGGGVCVRHTADHEMQVCRMLPLRDGVPLDPNAQIVRLTQGDGPGMDVEVLYDRHESCGKGPAKVTSQAYRSNFDRIFGTRPEVGSA